MPPAKHESSGTYRSLKARQLVRLKQPGVADAGTNAAGVYEITRLMPADPTGELPYRITSGAIERAAPEGEIQSL
jgi:hypothetical protein